MKIYSYLHSGVPTLATRLPTHTQVLSDEIALLAEPSPEEFGLKLQGIMTDAEQRSTLGKAAFQTAEQLYTFPVFERNLNSLYDRLSTSVDRKEALAS